MRTTRTNTFRSLLALIAGLCGILGFGTGRTFAADAIARGSNALLRRRVIAGRWLHQLCAFMSYTDLDSRDQLVCRAPGRYG